MSVIGVLGPICSGKETFCEWMKQTNHYRIIKFNEDLEIKKQVTEIYNQWREPTIIINLVNSKQVKALQKRSYFHLVYIDAPIHIRFRRYRQKHMQVHFEEFAKLDDEFNFKDGLQEMAKHCKVILKNNFHNINDFIEYLQHESNKIIRSYRPNWDVYFMKIAYTIKTRSNCMKKSVGAILVNQDRRILSTSYNGTPKVMLNCNEGGCEVCRLSKSLDLILYKCLCIHAEEGCILELGIAQTRGATLYTTLFPCVWCCKALLQAGVVRIVYSEQGNWKLPLQFLNGLIQYDQVNIDQYIY